jgi:hypothetical protein
LILIVDCTGDCRKEDEEEEEEEQKETGSSRKIRKSCRRPRSAPDVQIGKAEADAQAE